MTGAGSVAGAAGALAAVALVELGPRGPRGRRIPRGRALAMLGRLGRRLGAPVPPRDLDARLALAGRPFGLRAADAMAVKGGAGAVGLILGLLLGAALPGRLSLFVTITAPAAAFFVPDLWLRRAARRRGLTMDAELPELLDLLRVVLVAGVPLDRAFAEVARRTRGLLAAEWRAVAAQIAVGIPRERALSELVVRCPCAGVATLVRAFERATRHGAPMEETLAALARETRATRARQVAEQAAHAAPQIQLVVALLLVPSVLLLVAAALIASLLA